MKVILIRGRAIDPNVNKFAEALSQNGHDVKLLVWDRQHTLKLNKTCRYAVQKFGFSAPYDKPITLLFIPFWWVYQFIFLIREKADVIHACDLDTLIPAIPVKLIKRTKLCYTIYDYYANILPDGRFQTIRNFIRRLVSSIENSGIGFVDFLFLTDDSLREHMDIAKIHKFTYIYNSPDDYYAGKGVNTTGEKNWIDILYIGVLIKSRGLDCMIKAIDGLEDVKLTIGGVGPDRQFIEAAAKRYHNIQYLGWTTSYKEIMDITSKTDLTFRFSDPNIPATKYVLPNKLFEAMMCGKPIIVTEDSAAAEIVRKEQCGLVVNYGAIDELRDTVVTLKNSPQLRRQLGNNGRKAYDEKYSWNIMEKRILTAYKNIDN